MATEEERTFNEAMNEWAAKQSFFHDTRNRLVHPDPTLSWPLRVLGYLLRLAVLVLAIWFVANFVIKRYVGGSGFADMMAEKTAELLSASDFENSEFEWKGDRATTKLFKATGSDDAFYKEFEAFGISFEMPKSQLFSKAWHLDSLRIAQLDMLLRVGRTSGITEARPAAPDMVLAGLGINPDINKLKFDRMEIADGTFRWGVSSTTRGSIAGAPLMLAKLIAAPGGWGMAFAGGTLTQNWWRDISIESLEVLVQPERLIFSKGQLALAGGGLGKLQGELRLGAVPEADLQLDLAGATAESLTPKEFHRFVGGTVDASVVIGGSPNTRAGFASRVTMEVGDDVQLRKIPVFEALSILLESTRIRQLPLTSGTISFETGDGEMRVTEIDLVSDQVGRLRGAFNIQPVTSDTTDSTDIDSIDREAAARRNRPFLEQWEFVGKLQFGVHTNKFPLGAPAAEGLFQDGGDGLSWIEIPLSGPITEVTRAQHDRIVAAIRNNQ